MTYNFELQTFCWKSETSQKSNRIAVFLSIKTHYASMGN
ncbi:hypothetical protein GJA_4431 [Janthinobacterium agaricidamnosum NBRC 102515 = DSM 9628]|uniref:Uncharacterized protein n=1 Tax=Janthinobacterium agaricidamnosum NBRC 102515 = DSM 9628 TaxID=1349767 RepID=W0VCE9_9BURK|nr:hypothetical protein GJA_4431 [Janthinobacterium agaricidamnosum NBRC 102515 = DSM 9628]